VAFSDSMIGSNDFDPQAATEDLIRQVSGPLPATLDPKMLNTRLGRKLGEEPTEPAKVAKPAKEDLDFSSQAQEPSNTAPSDTLDFSSQVEPAPAPPPPPSSTTPIADALHSVHTNIDPYTAGKGFVAGAIKSVGGLVQGLGTQLAVGHGTMPPEGNEFAANPMPTDAAGRITTPSKAVAASPMVSAGKAIKSVAPEMSPDEQSSIAGQVGQGAGGIAPYVAATALAGPAIGIAAGFVGMAADTYGKVFEEAKAKGADDETAVKAAERSALVAGVVGGAQVGAGKVASKLAQSLIAKAAASAAIFTTTGEAQEWALQQIAKTYDKEAGYTPEAKRIIAEIILGAGMGMFEHAQTDHVQSNTSTNTTGGQAGRLPPPAGGGPQPGSGPSPGPQPNTGGGTRQQGGTQPPPGGNAGSQGGPQPNAPGGGGAGSQQSGPSGTSSGPAGGASNRQSFTMDSRMRAKMEKIFRMYEPGADVSGMSDTDLFNKVNDHLRDTSSTGHTAKPETPEEAAARESTAKKRSEDEILRSAGWTDAHINAMTPEQRAKYTNPQAKPQAEPGAGPKPTSSQADDEAARKAGFRNADEVGPDTYEPVRGEHNREFGDRDLQSGETPVVEPTSKSDVGTRAAPIVPKTADDVVAAQPAEPTEAQAHAENYQHAHMDLPQFGLTGANSISIETGIGQTRSGIGEDGKRWEVKMQGGAYGRIKGTKAADFKVDKEGNPVLDEQGNPVRQNLDIKIGPHPTSPYIFIVDQHDPKTGKFDEHKILAGYRTPLDALHGHALDYGDHAEGRIGHVTAMGPEEFKAWLKTDTTKPLKPETAPPASEAVEAGARSPLTEASVEAGKSEVPKAKPTTEATGEAAGSIPQGEAGSKQVEKILGENAGKVAQVDIARAGEILDENEGMSPHVAFGHAVIESLVGQGFITHDQAEQAYGKEVKNVLGPRSEGAPVSGAPSEQERAAPEQERAGGTEENGKPAHGGKAGKGGSRAAPDERRALPAPSKSEAAEQPAASGEQATGNEAGNAAEDEAAATAARVAASNEADFAPFEANRAALPNFRKKGTKVEFTQQGDFRQPDGTLKQGRLVKGVTTGVASKDLGTVLVKEDGAGTWTVGAEHLTLSPKEPTDGVPPPVHGSNAGPESEAVPEAPGQRGVGPVREPEGAGSEEAAGLDFGGQAEDLAGGARSGGTGPEPDVRIPERHEQPEAGRAEGPVQRDANAVAGENYRIEPGALAEERSPRRKAADNVAAIKLANQLVAEDRPATAAEQHQLARYVGWGGLKGAFPDANGEYGNGFESIGAELKNVLTPDEYDTARRSIQYAHYTAEDVISGMWTLAQRLGFKGGQVFEPGMGVGHFAGMMPADVAARTAYHGVEMDHVTARIAKLLYPKWGVRREDFTKMPLAQDTFDLVIGNPPFADIAVQSDPKYKQGFLLHDYFFAKSLDAVRPGGLLAFVTSAGTMNKVDPAAREYLAKRANFVGGIRLPSNAFKKNAGTEVTTDILVFRKLMPGEESKDWAWTQVGQVELPGPEGTPIKGMANRYFTEHPEMVLGKADFADKLYQGRYSVKAMPGYDLRAGLERAIETFPTNIMGEAETPKAKAEADFEGTEKKDGSYYLKNGKLYQQRAGAGYEVERRGKGVEGGKTAAELDRIKGLVPIRDSLRETFAADLAGDAAAAKRARTKLNRVYDAFVEKFGPINKSEIQRRRPNSIQEESARAEAREEARYAGEPFDEGSFDPSLMIEAGKSLSEIARARKQAIINQGPDYREGGFEPDNMPDVIIDKRPNIDPFIDDQESYRLRAIEKYDEPTGKAEKGPIFTRDVISKDKPPEINSINDAALYVLNQKGTLDLDAIGALAGKSRSEAIEALGNRIYQVPGTVDTWETKEKYLSGNVRKKLAIAKAEAARNPAFRRNAEALEAAQPAPLAPSQIGASLGMPWLPSNYIEQFATEELGLSSLKANYVPQIATWSVTGDSTSVASTSTWGTSRRNAAQLMLDALNRQSPKIYDQLDNDKRVLNAADTQAAQEKMQAIRDKFEQWIFADEKRADRLASIYNENYNNLVVQDFNGDYLTTPGISAEWSWRPHQKRVIARIIQEGNTYMAHAVGAGKTSAMIGAGMEMRRLGLVKKPMYTVPNHMLAQFTKEFYEQYPTARIMVADERQFHTDRRKQFMANVALTDLDAVIITHSAFGLIPVSDEFQDQIIESELNEYRKALEDVPKGFDNRITRSRIEKQIERLEQRLSGQTTRKKDRVFTFDEMGVDFLFVDEAHKFRKLDFNTQMSNLKGITPQGSGQAWDLYVKSKLLETKNPGRNLVLASGTPVTNTMAELYTVSRYLQRNELDERRLSHFDAWAGAFGENVTELEQDAAGGYKPVSRFAKFVNVAELSSMVRQVMDVVTSRQLEQYVVRPKLKGGKRIMNLAEKSPSLERYQADLAKRMKAMEGRGKPQPGDDIMLKVIGDGRHAAIDMRLVGGRSNPDYPSKLDLLIDNVASIWKRTRAQKFYKPKDGAYDMSKPADTGPATQMIFANLGISGSRGFAVPDYIRAELVRRGIPRNEIAFIADFKSHVQKQKLFNDMNEGKVRVLIGSTDKMATGVNAQRRLYAIHNQDPLWYPSDDEQRNGRALRQGNMNPEIEIHDYSTKGTYDSTMWGMMEKKARFIQGFFEGDPSLRSMDDLGEASQYEQAKALTTNDPRLMKLTELRQEYEKANRRKAAFDNERYAIRQKRAQAKNDIEYYQGRQAGIEKDIAQRIPLAGDQFKAQIGKETFDNRVDFGDALMNTLDKLTTKENANISRVFPVGEISGFQLVAKVHKIADSIHVSLNMRRNGGAESHITVGTSGLGATRSMEWTISGFDSDLEHVKAKIATDKKFLKDSEGKQDETFTGGDEIAGLRKQIDEVQAELSKKPEEAKPETLPETTPDTGLSERDPTRAAQQNVLQFGRETGRERLIALSPDGSTLDISDGDARGVRFSPKLTKIALDPNSDADLVLHHNHPSDRSFSGTDFAMLTMPAIRTVWAHGHAGSVYRITLTPKFASTLDDDLAKVQKYLFAIENAASGSLGNTLIKWGESRPEYDNQVNYIHGHLIWQVFRDAGLVDYQSNTENPEWLSQVPGLAKQMADMAKALGEVIFNDNTEYGNGRYARSGRHAGDMAGLLEKPTVLSGERAQAEPDRASQALDRTQEGKGGERELNEPNDLGPLPDRSVTLGSWGDPSKVIKEFKRFWTSVFQPELVSDRALMADPLFARYKSSQAQEKDAIVRQSEGEWNYWNKRADPERIRFLDDVETAVFGSIPSDPVQARMAKRYRRMLDANWLLEKQYGSQASFVEDYFPHLWKSPDDWRAFAEARSAQVGPTWFQKKRTIDYITDGLAAGLELRYTNPVDIIVHRLLSGVDMRQRMELLYRMRDEGLAWDTSAASQGGAHLAARGWRLITAPDRRMWMLHPDIQPLWKNAVEAKGLWQDEHLGGSLFRGWMSLKNAWVPVKLAFSAFHPLHVLHINYSNGMAQGWENLVKGKDPVGALKAVAKGFTDPIIGAPGASVGAIVGIALGSTVGMPGMGGLLGALTGSAAVAGAKRAGLIRAPRTRQALAREAWSTRPHGAAWNRLTPEQRADVALMNDGGFVPQLSEQLKIGAKRSLAVAFQKALRGEAKPGDYWKMVTSAIRRGLEILQAPIFERWIPELKTSAYLQAASALLKRDPRLLSETNDRRLALRAIAKSIDNRFGEMFYGNLFWNRYLKDAAIGSFLSLGWNLGFVREFGGAAMEAVTRPAGLLPPFKPGAPRKIIRKATNKIPFALIYVASAALINAIMNKLFTGDNPEGLDFIFPRIGGLNPDSTPRRMTNMFYTREVPMLQKHIQERGGGLHGVISGTGEMIWNKMMFEPFHELLENRDYYGYNIWDENAPLYKQIWQGMKHGAFGESSPMSLTGAEQAARLSGKEFPSLSEAIGHPDRLMAALRAKGVDMSILGFGPAPSYVEKSAIQNRIGFLYREHVAPSSKPHADEENSVEKMAVRTAIMIAKRDKDWDMLNLARERGKAIGLSPKAMADVGKTPTDVYLFGRLPPDDQRAILRNATPEEQDRYLRHAHLLVRQEINRARYAPQPQAATPSGPNAEALRQWNEQRM
jgi:N12 class adenine-specific DNA methylase